MGYRDWMGGVAWRFRGKVVKDLRCPNNVPQWVTGSVSSNGRQGCQNVSVIRRRPWVSNEPRWLGSFKRFLCSHHVYVGFLWVLRYPPTVLMPGFHRARLHSIPSAPQFCSVFQRASYPTGSISEGECFARPILLTCSDFVDLFIFPWFLCFFWLGATSYIVMMM